MVSVNGTDMQAEAAGVLRDYNSLLTPPECGAPKGLTLVEMRQ